MSEETTVPCRHCNGKGTVAKPPRKPPVPLTEKEWLLYQDDLTTTVFVALSPDLVAVSRAFTADTDRYNRKKGRNIAQARMRNFLPIYHRDNTKNLYVTHYESRARGGHVIFEVVEPYLLPDEEEKFFKDVILPKFTPKTPEATANVPSDPGPTSQPVPEPPAPEALITRPEIGGQESSVA